MNYSTQVVGTIIIFNVLMTKQRQREVNFPKSKQLQNDRVLKVTLSDVQRKVSRTSKTPQSLKHKEEFNNREVLA